MDTHSSAKYKEPLSFVIMELKLEEFAFHETNQVQKGQCHVISFTCCGCHLHVVTLTVVVSRMVDVETGVAERVTGVWEDVGYCS